MASASSAVCYSPDACISFNDEGALLIHSPLSIFAAVLSIGLLLGGCVGYAIAICKIRTDGTTRDDSNSDGASRDVDVKQEVVRGRSETRLEPEKDEDDTADSNRQQLLQTIIDTDNTSSIIIGSEAQEEDGPTMVLRGSLDLMASKWGVVNDNPIINNSNSSNHEQQQQERVSKEAVVEYLSPEQMTQLLFSKVNPNTNNISQTLCLDEYEYPPPSSSSPESEEEESESSSSTTTASPKSSTADITSLIQSTTLSSNNSPSSSPPTTTPTQFIQLLTLLQKYSVNTSHPYFFNQLFGSLDPIALAAEVVALSVNTSVYTYETAPVFTLLEREVMGQIGRLVFGCGGGGVKDVLLEKDDGGDDGDVDKSNGGVEGGTANDEGSEGSSSSSSSDGQTKEKEFEGEGLMIPGGSLANLTAMHAARHRWKVMNGYTTKQQQQQQQQQQRDEQPASSSSVLEEDSSSSTRRLIMEEMVNEAQHYWQNSSRSSSSSLEEEKKLEDDASLHHVVDQQQQHQQRNQEHVPLEEQNQLQQQQQQQEETEVTQQQQQQLYNNDNQSTPDLVAFVSSEAHYSFSKSARVLGLREDDLIVIPTHSDGRMNVSALAKKIEELEYDCKEEVQQAQQQEEASTRQIKNSGSSRCGRKRVPFFVACTAGSTVRGSFDEIAKIVKVCRSYEARGSTTNTTTAPPSSTSSRKAPRSSTNDYQRSIWVHVDGAWGGSAIFSTCPTLRSTTHMDEIQHADSFTFNPHKMLGAPQQTTAFIVRHRRALRNANAYGAKYLFDPRKNGAEYDLGDLSYTCGRRTDAVKLWALWKYYGRGGLGQRVDQKVDELECFVEEMRTRSSFVLACKPWPFNVNFFYFPPRIRDVLEARGVYTEGVVGRGRNGGGKDDEFIEIPDDIAEDLANVSVQLKLRLHEAGEMIIPYQPLNNQRADCFRLVLAGKKDFGIKDIRHVLDTMEKYGNDL